MSYIIAIEMKKASKFLEEATVVLESFKYKEINEVTFLGSTSASTVIDKLKALDIYKKDKTGSGIKLHYGSISST